MSRHHVLAVLAVFVFLMIVNAIVFPLVFPDGLAEKFANERAEALPLYHTLGLAATAVLLVVIGAKIMGDGPPWREGLRAGAWLGLLVALPEHLHLYAMVDASVVVQFIPVVWILVTWGIAGIIAGSILARAEESDAAHGA